VKHYVTNKHKNKKRHTELLTVIISRKWIPVPTRYITERLMFSMRLSILLFFIIIAHMMFSFGVDLLVVATASSVSLELNISLVKASVSSLTSAIPGGNVEMLYGKSM
jgi:hypothetical protein